MQSIYNAKTTIIPWKQIRRGFDPAAHCSQDVRTTDCAGKAQPSKDAFIRS